MDLKPKIRVAILNSGVKLNISEFENLVEAIDIELDRTIPNSSYNFIAADVLSDIEIHIRNIKMKVIEGLHT